ncbi:MAG: hypothetical protein ACTIL3_12965, partial [Brevibacterium aurantiacum]
TVIDPIVAVAIGAAFFGEYTGLTPMAVGLLLVAAAGGIAGVWMLSQFHPRVLEAKSVLTGLIPAAVPAHLSSEPRTPAHTSQGIRS